MKKQEFYQYYLKIPKYSESNPNNIFTMGCCVLGQDQMHYFPPSHRHYSFEEFSTQIDYNEEFKQIIINFIKKQI